MNGKGYIIIAMQIIVMKMENMYLKRMQKRKRQRFGFGGRIILLCHK